ncbi:cathepsin K-like [Brachyhypopomus gauderio]|uniref:cathepsin K-like n=1 Tax=Brachyhypopomus gauderio TaxID=698409 RepID=UPI00404307F1
MRSMLVFPVVLNCLSLTFCTKWTTLQRWQEWKQQNKEDFGLSSDDKRRAIWTENFNAIADHNRRFLLGLSNFTMAMNKFGAAMFNEYVGILNAKVRWTPLMVPQLGSSPDSLDYRDLGLVTPVKDQGACISSWAFSVAGAIEAQVAKTTGVLVPLSAQNLVDCSANATYGCDGGWLGSAYNYIQQHGINSEASYPYQAKDDQGCMHDPDENVIMIHGHGRLPPGHEEILKKALASFGPVTVSVDANSFSFMFYKMGIYDDPPCDAFKLTLDVLLVGYGSENGVDYWIIKNSWGIGWGEKGYMRLLRNGSNFRDIASNALYPFL